MMEKRGERLRAYIEYKNIGPKEFGENIQASKATVNHWLNDKSLTLEWLFKIGEYYHDLNIAWLLSGEGAMVKDQCAEKEILAEKRIRELEEQAMHFEEKIQQLEEINELLRENNKLLKSKINLD